MSGADSGRTDDRRDGSSTESTGAAANAQYRYDHRADED
jgi:hypothetical protein